MGSMEMIYFKHGMVLAISPANCKQKLDSEPPDASKTEIAHFLQLVSTANNQWNLGLVDNVGHSLGTCKNCQIVNERDRR